MVQQTNAWKAHNGDLFSQRNPAIARELELMINPGEIPNYKLSDGLRWIVENWEQVKEVVEQ